MLKKKYLSDFQSVDINKPKGKKILKKFKEEVNSINKKILHIDKGYIEEIERNYIDRSVLLSSIKEMKKLYLYQQDIETKIEIYKNDYDDFFLYISLLTNGNNRHSLSEYIFLLDEKLNINYDPNCISLIYLNQYPYDIKNLKNNYYNYYSIIYSNINHSTSLSYNQNKIDKVLYNYSEVSLTEESFYSAKFTQKQNNHGNHVALIDRKNDTEIYVNRISHSDELVSSLYYRNKNNIFEINIELDSIYIELSIKDEYGSNESFFNLQKKTSILSTYDDFQKNDYYKEEYNNIDSLLDMLPLTHDIELSKEEKHDFSHLCYQIPNMYEQMKHINRIDSFSPKIILSALFHIIKDRKKSLTIKKDCL